MNYDVYRTNKYERGTNKCGKQLRKQMDIGFLE
jgi:hypothetical protein